MKKRIFLFRKALTQEGGAERLMLEVAGWFERLGCEVRVVSIRGKRTAELFNGVYAGLPVRFFREGEYPVGFFSKIIISLKNIGKLRQEILSFQPDIMLAQNQADAEMLYLASLRTKIPYAIFLYASFFNFPDDGLKYMAPFRRVFEKIRNSTPGHKTFIPLRNPVRGLFARAVLQGRAWVNYLVVRRAALAFSMTRRKAWENELFYGRPVIDIKGGANPSFFSHKKSKNDIRTRYGFPPEAKLLVNVGRLVPGKRVELCIRTLAELKKKRNDIYLAVGGKGPEKDRLEALIDELKVRDRVILAGFITEGNLPYFYASADAIFHPAWVDFDLTVMESLSSGKKVVCSTDYDLSGDFESLREKFVFQAEPEPAAMAEAVERALAVGNPPAKATELFLADYSWKNYSKKLLEHLFHNEEIR